MDTEDDKIFTSKDKGYVHMFNVLYNELQDIKNMGEKSKIDKKIDLLEENLLLKERLEHDEDDSYINFYTIKECPMCESQKITIIEPHNGLKKINKWTLVCNNCGYELTQDRPF